MSQRNMHRTALLLMVGSGILLTAGNGTDAYPIVGYSQAVAASEDSTGILLEQSVQGLVPLLGYGDIRETRTQPPEDESTWHTLTTEELLGADGILPQSGGKETQEVAEPAESTSATAGGEFVPAGRQMQIDLAQLKDYESLVGNFYAIDANTMIGSDQLSVDKFMEIDMTMAKQEGEGPQILIYHTHSQESYKNSKKDENVVAVGQKLTDLLTEKGWKEAEYLSERLSKLDVKDFYVSPLGRAKDTASFTLKKMNRTAVECDWLREFDVLIDRPDVTDRQKRLWDWLPQDWTQDERFYQYDHWYENERLQQSDAKGYYDYVTGKFDKLLAEHGYVREGHYYRVEKPNEDTLVFFCHFGLECVLLAHLIGASPMVLWHGFCAAPSSVTTVNTEERREGIASFRISAFGDISHLYVHDEPPAFAARFCEMYSNTDERHD